MEAFTNVFRNFKEIMPWDLYSQRGTEVSTFTKCSKNFYGKIFAI
jgi:hypothetical protein